MKTGRFFLSSCTFFFLKFYSVVSILHHIRSPTTVLSFPVIHFYIDSFVYSVTDAFCWTTSVFSSKVGSLQILNKDVQAYFRQGCTNCLTPFSPCHPTFAYPTVIKCSDRNAKIFLVIVFQCIYYVLYVSARNVLSSKSKQIMLIKVETKIKIRPEI